MERVSRWKQVVALSPLYGRTGDWAVIMFGCWPAAISGSTPCLPQRPSSGAGGRSSAVIAPGSIVGNGNGRMVADAEGERQTRKLLLARKCVTEHWSTAL